MIPEYLVSQEDVLLRAADRFTTPESRFNMGITSIGFQCVNMAPNLDEVGALVLYALIRISAIKAFCT